ncbi:MAG: VWA domain-containing protein [Methanobrevibacter sp.]|jgi:magnesium chelatase subunit D|nr:VWA domain-containing protein [Candidatus Methanovirga aequatorialis]
MKRNIYPFTAIVGQEKIKKALILNAINPSIGGVLIKGDRGTGKTTAVRALASLLPEIEVVENSPFNVNRNEYMEFKLYKFNNKTKEDMIKTTKKHKKIVELPLGATEDRVVGSMNIEKGLKEGIKQLEPGILANANNNVLYIDEINLLDDNLIDVLLDAAAFGVNTVEREGISIKHPSKFVLIGTMNPEEGELRKQLSDRIGLEILVKGVEDIKEKIKIMEYRQTFEKNPRSFKEKFESRQKELKEKIKNAIEILDDVEIKEELIKTIAMLTNNLGLEGHRKDITILKTSKTIAALEGSREVSYDNLIEAIELVLGEYPDCASNLQNTFQKNNEEENNEKSDENQNKEKLNQNKEEENKSNEDEKNHDPNDGSNQNNEPNGDNEKDKQKTNQNSEVNQEKQEDELEEENENLSNQTQSGTDFKTKENENKDDDLRIKTLENQSELNKFQIKELEKDINKILVVKGREKEKLYGSRVNSKTEKGKYVKTKFSSDYKDIAIDATLRAAAIHSKNKITVKKEDLRTKIRKHKAKASIAVVMDMSGSMMSDEKINKIKGILYKIIKNINKNKDKLSVVGFKGKESEIIIPNTKRPSSFLDKLEQIKVGGTTPMATGLKKGYEILKKENKKGEFIPMLILLSDGMPNVGIKNSEVKTLTGSPIKDVLAIGKQLADEKIYTIIINFEKKIKQGRNVSLELAIISNGRYYDLENVQDSSATIDKILTYERTLL